MFRLIACVGFALVAHAAWAADQPRYEPPPAWVKPLEIPKPATSSDGGSTRLLLEDFQDKFGPDGVDSYWEEAERIETPQGLSNLGNIAFDWNPDTEELLIHRVRIIRGDQVIDLLAGGQKFVVLRRENKLEYAMLDGTLTAAIEPEGLQVGDILDLAVGYISRDPIMRGRSARFFSMPTVKADRFAVRELWPKSETPHWQVTVGLDQPKISMTPDGGELLISMANAIRPTVPKRAPDRYSHPGRFQISQVGDWPDVSSLMAPYYDKSAVLKPDSLLRPEIAKIKAASSDPKVQAAAALRLVQDQVRYLFLGMNNGGYIPAPADVSWSRRFGDCKGKTVLLLAMLRELGIQAEPALVDTEFGEEVDTRPAMVGAFDHVIVRATIDGKVYWMDGTRPADRSLDNLLVPDFHWALPLRAAGATLEKLVVPPFDKPEELRQLRLDASAGLDVPAPAHVDLILRGEAGIRERLKFVDMSKAETEKSLREYWTKEYDWIDIKQVDLAYDEVTGEEHFSMDGSAKMEWRGKRNSNGRRYETDGGILGWKADYDRESGPNQDVPYAVSYPDFTKVMETIILPNGGKGFTIDGDDVDKTIAARQFNRTSKIENGVFTMEASTRAIAPEFAAAEAPAAKKDLLELSKTVVHVRAPDRYKMTDQEMALLDKPATADDFFDLAFQYDLRDDYTHAIPNYDHAIQLTPGWALAYANRGSDRFYSGDMQDAAADFDKALSLDPSEAVAIRGHGLIFAKNGKFKEAIDAFSEALLLAPSNTFGLEQRARAYMANHEGDKALADINEILRLQPNRFDIHDLLLELLIARRDSEKLTAEADQLAKMKADAGAHFARGYALLFQAKKDEARGEFDAAIAIKPVVSYYMGRALTYDKSQLDESLKDIDLALKLQPDADYLYYMRAQFYMSADKPELAIKDFDRLLQKTPDNGQLLRQRAFALAKNHQYDLAVAGIDQLLSKTPDDSVLLNNGCWYRALSGQNLQSAMVNCDASLKIKQDPATWDSRGMVDLRLANYDQAISDYDTALKLNPKQADSLFGRGLAKLRKGASADGQVDLATARAIDPQIDTEYADYGLKP